MMNSEQPAKSSKQHIDRMNRLLNEPFEPDKELAAVSYQPSDEEEHNTNQN